MLYKCSRVRRIGSCKVTFGSLFVTPVDDFFVVGQLPEVDQGFPLGLAPEEVFSHLPESVFVGRRQRPSLLALLRRRRLLGVGVGRGVRRRRRQTFEQRRQGQQLTSTPNPCQHLSRQFLEIVKAPVKENVNFPTFQSFNAADCLEKCAP